MVRGSVSNEQGAFDEHTLLIRVGVGCPTVGLVYALTIFSVFDVFVWTPLFEFNVVEMSSTRFVDGFNFVDFFVGKLAFYSIFYRFGEVFEFQERFGIDPHSRCRKVGAILLPVCGKLGFPIAVFVDLPLLGLGARIFFLEGVGHDFWCRFISAGDC